MPFLHLVIQLMLCYRDIHSLLSKSLSSGSTPGDMPRWCGQGIFHHPIGWSRGFGVWRRAHQPPPLAVFGMCKGQGSWLPQKKTCVQKCFILFRRKFQSCISRKLQVTKCLDLFIMFFSFNFLMFFVFNHLSAQGTIKAFQSDRLPVIWKFSVCKTFYMHLYILRCFKVRLMSVHLYKPIIQIVLAILFW